MNANSTQLHTTVSIGFFPTSTVADSRFATRADIAEAFQERLITRLQDLAEATAAPGDEEWTLGDDPDERDLDDEDEDEEEWEIDGEDDEDDEDEEEDDGDEDDDLDDLG